MSNLHVSAATSIQESVDLEIFLVTEGMGQLNGQLPSEAIAGISGFTGKIGQAIIASGADSEEVSLFAGVGNGGEVEDFRLAGAAAIRLLAGNVARVGFDGSVVDPEFVSAFVEGAVLASYRYDKLRGKGFDSRSIPKLEILFVATGKNLLTADLVARAVKVAEATCFARDLINEHSATMTPTRFAQIAVEICEGESLECRVWDKAQIEKEGLGGLLAVSRGSIQEPRFVKISYRPNGIQADSAIALVGKGITFDSGGLSLKSGDGMMTMKTDMSGAAAVLATMSVLKDLEVRVPVDGYMALTENMPSGSATKPGDVLVARNGKSIEVLNTDAEGRLVLADALSLAVEDNASEIIDLATLTGACVVALGREIAGAMGTDQPLVDRVLKAGKSAGEPLWQLPLPERYKKHIESEVADMKNIGAPGAAGTLSAALLLREFVAEVPWVHLDIAGPSRAEADERYFRKGGTGFGVRTLCHYLTSKQ